MTGQELIEAAKKDTGGDNSIVDVLTACEAYYMSGSADEQSGDVGWPTGGHFYRVDRWIVHCDEQGFRFVNEYNSEDEAKFTFEELDQEYGEWCEDESA